MLVVSDVQDVFVPLLDGFLVTLSKSEAMIDMYVLIMFHSELKLDSIHTVRRSVQEIMSFHALNLYRENVTTLYKKVKAVLSS